MSFEDALTRLRQGRLSRAETQRLRSKLTLGHFRDGDRLIAVCSRCSHAKVIAPRRLRRTLPPLERNAYLPSLERRLICGNCKTGGNNRFLLLADAED